MISCTALQNTGERPGAGHRQQRLGSISPGQPVCRRQKARLHASPAKRPLHSQLSVSLRSPAPFSFSILSVIGWPNGTSKTILHGYKSNTHSPKNSSQQFAESKANITAPAELFFDPHTLTKKRQTTTSQSANKCHRMLLRDFLPIKKTTAPTLRG